MYIFLFFLTCLSQISSAQSSATFNVAQEPSVDQHKVKAYKTWTTQAWTTWQRYFFETISLRPNVWRHQACYNYIDHYTVREPPRLPPILCHPVQCKRRNEIKNSVTWGSPNASMPRSNSLARLCAWLAKMAFAHAVSLKFNGFPYYTELVFFWSKQKWFMKCTRCTRNTSCRRMHYLVRQMEIKVWRIVSRLE